MQISPKAVRAISVLLFIDGLIAIGCAIFAHALGIDPNPDWGRSRIFLFLFGGSLLALSIFLRRKNPALISSDATKTFTIIGHTWAVILVIYVWFITFGTFTEWRASTRYYSLLADAFSKGQLHVDVEPGAALLAADDPYNNEGRPPFDDDVWDLSLYKGKLYLYWGPVPALLLTPIQLVLNKDLADIYPVFFFFCGLLILNSLIALKMRRLFFADIPMRNVTASLLVLGLILPIPWSLSIPDVYEAAIGAGQFFLIGGIYFVILAFEYLLKPPSPAEGMPPKAGLLLFLAGLFWACSVGSRAINVLSIFFLTAFTLYWIWKTCVIDWIKSTAPLLTPLVLGAILIGWYNYARFDDPLEFGLRYQITVQNMNRDMPLAFELEYLPYNFTAYVLQPFQFVSGFPFIRPVGYTGLIQDHGITAPGLYAAGNVTGMLFFAPFLLLAFLPFVKPKPPGGKEAQVSDLRRFILYLLGGPFLIGFTSILFYYYGQMRFLVDVISQITLLAVFGYWTVVRRFPKAYLYFANLLIVITLTISLLLSVTSESGRMEKLNPAFDDGEAIKILMTQYDITGP
ncbi:MAG: hypothetical protein HS100_05120 [Anaerolineales bacterium]|nr:hypothetical protein [Anaerolineales bacterium]